MRLKWRESRLKFRKFTDWAIDKYPLVTAGIVARLTKSGGLSFKENVGEGRSAMRKSVASKPQILAAKEQAMEWRSHLASRKSRLSVQNGQ
jgi:hypothetical protein